MTWIVENVYLLLALACVACLIVSAMIKSQPSIEDQIAEMQREIDELRNK